MAFFYDLFYDEIVVNIKSVNSFLIYQFILYIKKKEAIFLQDKILDITDIVALAILEQLLNEQIISQDIFERAKVMLSQV